jgi:hypothetical protein
VVGREDGRNDGRNEGAEVGACVGKEELLYRYTEPAIALTATLSKTIIQFMRSHSKKRPYSNERLHLNMSFVCIQVGH